MNRLAQAAAAFEALAGASTSANANEAGYMARIVAALTALTATRKQGVGTSHTGSTAETAIGSIVLPAGSLDEDGSFARASLVFSATGTAGTKTVKVKIGTTVLFTTAMTANNLAYGANLLLFNIGGTLYCATSTGSDSAIPTEAAIPAGTVTLAVTGTLANGADSVRLRGYQIEVYPAPLA